MDPMAFQLANALVGNPLGKEGLEITLTGPDLMFLGDAVVALTGSAISATLDGNEFPMWQRVSISAGQRLNIGKTTSNAGCRSYLAVYGGFLNVAEWFGSKATVPITSVGGYQGRQLRTGDLLRIADSLPPELETRHSGPIPGTLLPKYTEDWDIRVMHGPYCEGYLAPEDVDLFYDTTWDISHNAARGGVRLVGPRPKWARSDGGDGGAHPSNVIEYGYPMGGINFTGDEPVILPNDCPDFGGFVCPFTVVKGDYWKVGQLRSGNKVRFHPVSLEEALRTRRANEAFVETIAERLSSSGSFEGIERFDNTPIPPAPSTPQPAVLKTLPETPTRPLVTYSQGGDDYLLIDYGTGQFDINHKCRTTALKRKLESSTGPIRFSATGEGIYTTVCIGNSMMVYHNGLRTPQPSLLSHLASLEDELGDLSAATVPNRTFTLPITFTHRKLAESLGRYMANQRPHASYLPDTFRFVAENNGITPGEYRALWLAARFVVVGVGFFMGLPACLPEDPRHRLRAPKMNPSRTHTPEGAAGWGGSCAAVYPAESPGGYMPAGMTIPGADALGYKRGFEGPGGRPWLFDDMDVVAFEEVGEAEYDRLMGLFRSGRYGFAARAGVFDMAAHNALLREAAGEAAGVRARQRACRERMAALEGEMLARWDAERRVAAAAAAGGVSVDGVRALLDGE